MRIGEMSVNFSKIVLVYFLGNCSSRTIVGLETIGIMNIGI